MQITNNQDINSLFINNSQHTSSQPISNSLRINNQALLINLSPSQDTSSRQPISQYQLPSSNSKCMNSLSTSLLASITRRDTVKIAEGKIWREWWGGLVGAGLGTC